MRKQKRYFRAIGVEFESEKAERTEQQTILGDNLMGKVIKMEEKDEKAPDSVDGIILRDTPVVFVQNLDTFLADRLDEYQVCDQLVWSYNNIPSDEIWVKVGGDHGGDSFKVCLQILNLRAPNAKENTIVVMCFKGRDYHNNLVKALGPLHEQINKIQEMKWKGKRVRTFAFGDYEFLCKLYGISGACGTF